MKKHDKVCGCRSGSEFLQVSLPSSLSFVCFPWCIKLSDQPHTLFCCTANLRCASLWYLMGAVGGPMPDSSLAVPLNDGVAHAVPQQLWSGSKRSHGSFLHSPLMEELKVAETS